MEKVERLSEEETFLWFPFRFLDQTLRAILKCLGLLHHDFPKSTVTATSPVTLNQPLQKVEEDEEEEEEEEEEEGVAMKDDVIVTTRGIKKGVVLTSRGTKVKAKGKNKAKVSPGRGGQHHDYDV